LGQSGFQLESHAGRTLAEKDVKKIEVLLAQSISAIMHSYTIQPIILIDNRLLSPLFIVLKEFSGTLGSTVQEIMFIANNIFIMALKSGN